MAALFRRFRMSYHRRASLFLVAFAILLAPAPVFAQEYTYAECDAIGPADLEAEIAALARAVLDEGQDHLDIDAIVERQWSAVGMGPVLDQEVDRAVQQLMTTEPYWTRFWSGWSGPKAEEYAAAIAELVFSSPTFTAKLDELATAIADELAIEVAAMAARSASTSMLCLQQFVGERYSKSLLALFAAEIDADVEEIDFAGIQDEVGFSQLESHNKAAVGVSVIVVSQLVRRISVSLGKKVAGRVAGRIAGRLVGRLGSSLIPFAGWVVGGGLILWDLYEGGKGSLPQIQEALQSEEVKASLRAEVALAVEEGLEAEIEAMADQIALELLTSWRGFCDQHVHLCTLPEENTDFQVILDTTSVDDLEKLARLVDLFLATLGRDELDGSLENGVFENLLRLPIGALLILEETGSADAVLAWAEVAGPQIEAVATSQLYAQVDPSAITDSGELSTLLALDDEARIAAYLGLDDDVRQAFQALPESDRRTLLDTQRQSEINWLFHYASAEKLIFPLLVSRINGGTVTIEELRSPPQSKQDAATVSPAGDALSVPKPLVPDVNSTGRPNSVWVAVLVLSVLLAISTFAMVAFYVVKHR